MLAAKTDPRANAAWHRYRTDFEAFMATQWNLTFYTIALRWLLRSALREFRANSLSEPPIRLPPSPDIVRFMQPPYVA
jgi:hypothetical protein